MASPESASSQGRISARVVALSLAVLGASLGPPASLVAAQDTASSTPPGPAGGAPTPDQAQAPSGDPTGAAATPSPTPAPPSPTPAPPSTGSAVGPAGVDPAPAPPATVVHASSSPTVSAAGSTSVSARDNFFAPPSITIQLGETVTWTNDGQVAHTVTANAGSFDSGNLNPGQSFSHSFAQSGTFAYYCQYHRSLGMTGTIRVVGSSSGGGSGGGTSSSGSTPTTPTTTTPATPTTPTGPGSESAAASSPSAAGSSTRLPSTGLPIVPPLVVAGLLIASGLLLRRGGSASSRS